MKQWLMCMMLLTSSLSMGQSQNNLPKVITVADFSGQYRADVTLSTAKNAEQQAVLRVYRKDNNQTVIEQETSIPDTDDYDDNAMLTLGGAGQGMLLHEDFNFDGIKDFAIMDNREACYGAPSYTVFVDTGAGFTKNTDLSQLSKNYCGFFKTDAQKRTIHMTTKIGCCEHVLETYRLVGKQNRLVLQKQEKIAIDSSEAYEHWLENTYDTKGKVISRKTKAKLIALEKDDFKPLFSFDIQDHGQKTVYVFALPNGQIDVASTFYQTHDVSLSLRMSKTHGILDTTTPAVLRLDSAAKRLCMVHNQVQYTLIDDGKQSGVEIKQGENKRFVRAKGKKQGALKQILQTPMINVQRGVCA